MATRCQDYTAFNTLSPKQNGRHFAYNIFKSIASNKAWMEISMTYMPYGLIDKKHNWVTEQPTRRYKNEYLTPYGFTLDNSELIYYEYLMGITWKNKLYM